MWSISRRYGPTITALASANAIPRKSVLRIGQQLRLPSAGKARAVRTANVSMYTVRKGDSLWTIAKRTGVALADLRSWNRMTSSKLRPGQRLRLKPPSKRRES